MEKDNKANLATISESELLPKGSAPLSRVPLLSPPTPCGLVRTYIMRKRSLLGSPPEYSVFVQGKDRLLMYAKKAGSSSNCYRISTNRDSHDANRYLGTLKKNNFRAQLAGKVEYVALTGDDERGLSQECVILYDRNLMGRKGPRKLKVCIPQVTEEHDTASRWTQQRNGNEMLRYLRENPENGDMAGLQYMISKEPIWNDAIKEHVLDFSGRVTQASVKNLQLTPATNTKHVLMQFGKVGRDSFTMDFRFPFTAFQAFAVALSSLDPKLVCA